LCANADFISPPIQLGAENNIEKSRCLAHLRKKSPAVLAAEAYFSGFCASSGARAALEAAATLCFQACSVMFSAEV
jgi:hypothetical protein